MSEVMINLKDYKASGVYFIEEDNSISVGTTNAALRLAVGFNEKGPFNRPVYLASPADCDEFLGPIDRRLERRGCYTNRAIRTMVAKAPVYALNLLNVNESDGDNNPDVAGYNAISFNAGATNVAGTTPFKNMYNRSRFWVPDATTMMMNIASDQLSGSVDSIDKSSLFGFGNAGTSDISIIVRKAEGIAGYNMTALEWYGSEADIPYKWIKPYDTMADFFIEVVAIAGDYTKYDNFASDSVWSAYFDANGLKKDKLSKFLRLDGVNVLGNWIGCIIPDFFDNQGKCKSIDYLINKNVNKTGLLFGYNADALDELDTDSSTNYINRIDMNGSTLTGSSNVDFMSYKFNMTTKSVFTAKATYDTANLCEFSCVDDPSNDDKVVPGVGDYVAGKNGGLVKIIKRSKMIDTDSSVGGYKYKFVTAGPVKFTATGVLSYAVEDDMSIPNDGETNPENLGYQDYMVFSTDGNAGAQSGTAEGYVDVHMNITNLYTNLNVIKLAGLKICNRHRPGFDENGVADIELGIKKIYSVLADEYLVNEDGQRMAITKENEYARGKVVKRDNGLRKGLMNENLIDFRYVVDTMGGGLGTECYSKKILSKFAMDRGHCTAIINAPSMNDFAKSEAPIFCGDFVDGLPRPAFNVKYIPEGGNQDHGYKVQYQDFTLPTEENGAKYCGVFGPYLKYRQTNGDILVPPAADVCNTFINKFLGGDPYKANANKNGNLNNPQISGVELDLDVNDRGYLEPFGFNSIIMKGNVATIYGDSTAYQNVNSDYNFLHVRELLNTIEIRCKAVLDDYPYEYNNPNTRAEIYTRIEPILKAMKTSGALAKYEIQIDENNNTKEIIDEKFCIVDIGIWITPTMEKVVARIKVNRGSEA